MLELTSPCTLQERHIAVSDQSQGRTRQSEITLSLESKLSLGVSAAMVLWARWEPGEIGGKHQIRGVPRAGWRAKYPSGQQFWGSPAPLQVTAQVLLQALCAASRVFPGVCLV